MTIGTNDFDRALGFYDQVLAGLGAKRGMGGERMPGFYGAYVRNLDGNKFCVFKMG